MSFVIDSKDALITNEKIVINEETQKQIIRSYYIDKLSEIVFKHTLGRVDKNFLQALIINIVEKKLDEILTVNEQSILSSIIDTIENDYGLEWLGERPLDDDPFDSIL